jgi:hypothetical protein
MTIQEVEHLVTESLIQTGRFSHVECTRDADGGVMVMAFSPVAVTVSGLELATNSETSLKDLIATRAARAAAHASAAPVQ